MKKRMISLLLVLALVVGICPAVLAAEAIETPVVATTCVSSNEYEMLLSMTADEESKICNAEGSNYASIEQIIKERASLPASELKLKGYDNEQIAILKAYDGGALEDNPQLAKAMASLNGTLTRIAYSSTYARAEFAWEWSNEPMLTGTAIHDIVVCAWRGTNNRNQECTMTFVPNNSYCSVVYNSGLTISGETYEIDIKDPQKNVEVKFPMSRGTSPGWAEKGTLSIAIREETAVKNLYSSTFLFGYGHMTFTVSPSIAVSGSGASMALSFGLGTSEEFNKSIIIRTNGTTEEL